MWFNFKELVLCAVLILSAFLNIFPQTSTIDTTRIAAYLEKARIYNVKNELDSSIYYDKILAKIFLLKADTAHAARMYNFIAKVFQKKFEFDSSFTYIQTALNLFPQNVLKPSPEIGELYNTLGTLYYNLGDYANAQIYFSHSLNIRLIYNKSTEKVIGDSYTNLGNLQFALEHYNEAIQYYRKSLEQRLAQYKINYVMVAKNLSNIGYTFLQKGNIAEAKKYFEQGFAYAPLAVLYDNLGRINTIENNFHAADTSLKKALEIRLAYVGEKHFLTAQSYYALGDLERARKNYKKALEYYSAALNSSIKSTEDKFFSGSHAKLYGILSIKEFFVSLNGKTGMLLKLAEKDSSLSRLQYAKQILSFCIPLLSSIQQFYDIDDSKLKLREISDETMNLGVEVCYELYRITREKKYAADAFLFSETKRNSVLNESTKNKTAMFEAQVPDSIKNLESSLRQKLKWLFISSADNLSEENENKTLNRENLIRTTVRSYKTLINSLKQNYPKYASLLAAGKILSPDELERGISKDAFLAEYTITENNIFIFCITNNSFTLVKTNKSRSFDNWNYSYRNSIKKIDKDTYNASAKELYRELVTPIEKELSGKRKLIVIPCPELSALPFEAFISSKGIPLVQNFSIQYCGSSNEFIKESRVVTKKYPYYFIGFAPSYNNLQKFAPLENQEEINEISKEIKNVGLQNILCSGPNATKQKFFDLTGKSRILHIAAHSFADTINEGSSGIVFDSLLTGSEIITTEINNDLIVLSSCEGGNGKTAGGEGILSLARNFLKAGAGNMLVSLWKVPDKQTKLFMTEFYRQLIKDNNYAEALSRTKRKVIEDKLYAFPNTWAAFVLLK